MVSIRDEEFSFSCQEGEHGDCVILNTLDVLLLNHLHPFHSRFIMLPIKGKKFPTVLPGAVYFLWESIAVKELGQTQELVADSHLTALGIKESTQQGQSMLDRKELLISYPSVNNFWARMHFTVNSLSNSL